MSKKSWTIKPSEPRRVSIVALSGIGFGMFWAAWEQHGFWWGVVYGLFWNIVLGYKLVLWAMGWA